MRVQASNTQTNRMNRLNEQHIKIKHKHGFQIARTTLSTNGEKALLSGTEQNSCANKSSQPLPHVSMPELKRKTPGRNVA